MCPPPIIDIARLFQAFSFLPTSLPTDRRARERAKEREKSAAIFVFSVLFLPTGSEVYPGGPGDRGGVGSNPSLLVEKIPLQFGTQITALGPSWLLGPPVGFDEQMFGGNEQVRGQGQSD